MTSQFDQLRAIHFQDTINRAMPRRKVKNIATTDPTEVLKLNDFQEREHTNSDAAEPIDVQAEPKRVQYQLLDDETRALQVNTIINSFL